MNPLPAVPAKLFKARRSATIISKKLEPQRLHKHGDPRFGSKRPQTERIPETIVCRILMFYTIYSI